MDASYFANFFTEWVAGLPSLLTHAISPILAHFYKPLDLGMLASMLREMVPEEPQQVLYWGGIAIGTILTVCFRRCIWVFPVWFTVVVITAVRSLYTFVVVTHLTANPPNEPILGLMVCDHLFSTIPSILMLLTVLIARPAMSRPTRRMWACAVATIIGYHCFVLFCPWILSHQITLEVIDDEGRPVAGAQLDYTSTPYDTFQWLSRLSETKHKSAVSDKSGRVNMRLLWDTRCRGTIHTGRFCETIDTGPTSSAFNWWVNHYWGAISMRGKRLSLGMTDRETVSYGSSPIKIRLRNPDTLHLRPIPQLENLPNTIIAAQRAGKRLQLGWECLNVQVYRHLSAIVQIPDAQSSVSAPAMGLFTYLRACNYNMRTVLDDLLRDTTPTEEREHGLTLLYEMVTGAPAPKTTWQQKRDWLRQRLDADEALFKKLTGDDIHHFF